MKADITARLAESIAKAPIEHRGRLAALFAEVRKRYEQNRLLLDHTNLSATSLTASIQASLHSIAAPHAEAGDFGALMSLLIHGKMRGGVKLTGRECAILLDVLRGHRKPPRRADGKASTRAMMVAHYSFLLERDGLPTEAAIRKTETLYGIKRSSVFAARKQFSLDYEPDTELRRALIAAFEARS